MAARSRVARAARDVEIDDGVVAPVRTGADGIAAATVRDDRSDRNFWRFESCVWLLRVVHKYDW